AELRDGVLIQRIAPAQVTGHEARQRKEVQALRASGLRPGGLKDGKRLFMGTYGGRWLADVAVPVANPIETVSHRERMPQRLRPLERLVQEIACHAVVSRGPGKAEPQQCTP